MRIWICAAFCCCAQMFIAQQKADSCQWSLSGIVVDEHDHTSLGYATIYLKELERGVVADSLGQFILTDLCTGVYTLRYSHLGCEPREDAVRINSHSNIRLHLEYHAELLQTIELHARRIQSAGTASRTELNVTDLRNATGRSLGEMLDRLSGVNTLQTGPAIFKPVIHGLHSNRVLILQDGLRLESQQWGTDHAPEIDPSDASVISVIKGSAAVQYGTDAVAGVILVESPALPSDGEQETQAHLTLMDNNRSAAISLAHGQSLGRAFAFRLNGSFRRGGDARAPDYHLTNTGLSEWTGGIVAGYQKGPKKMRLSYHFFRTNLGILQSAHVGNLTDLAEALTRDRPLIVEDFSYQINNPRQGVIHHTLLWNGQFQLTRGGLFFAQYAAQWNSRSEFDIRRGNRDDIPALDMRLHSQTGSVSFAHQPFGKWQGKISAHWNLQVNSNVPGTGIRPLIPNYTKYIPALSWVEKWINEHIEAEAGVRFEHTILQVKRINANNMLERLNFEFNNVAMSAGIRYIPCKMIVLASHVGFTVRAPSVNELFSEGLHHGVAAIEEGDPALVSEKALKWTTSVEARKSGWEASATFFLQPVSDFIYLLPGSEPRLTIRGAFPVFHYVQEDVVLKGCDAVLRFPLWKNMFWHSEYSMVRARKTLSKDDVLGIPSDKTRHSIEWEHEEKHQHMECVVEYTWKQTRTGNNFDYAPAPDGYLLLHLSAGADLLKDKLHVVLSIRNALNTSYREYMNRLRYYADDTGRSIELRLRYNL